MFAKWLNLVVFFLLCFTNTSGIWGTGDPVYNATKSLRYFFMPSCVDYQIELGYISQKFYK